MNKLITLFIVCLTLSAFPAFAQEDSVGLATGLATDFLTNQGFGTAEGINEKVIIPMNGQGEMSISDEAGDFLKVWIKGETQPDISHINHIRVEFDQNIDGKLEWIFDFKKLITIVCDNMVITTHAQDPEYNVWYSMIPNPSYPYTTWPYIRLYDPEIDGERDYQKCLCIGGGCGGSIMEESPERIYDKIGKSILAASMLYREKIISIVETITGIDNGYYYILYKGKVLKGGNQQDISDTMDLMKDRKSDYNFDKTVTEVGRIKNSTKTDGNIIEYKESDGEIRTFRFDKDRFERINTECQPRCIVQKLFEFHDTDYASGETVEHYRNTTISKGGSNLSKLCVPSNMQESILSYKCPLEIGEILEDDCDCSDGDFVKAFGIADAINKSLEDVTCTSRSEGLPTGHEEDPWGGGDGGNE
ncbi:MAG: hypothetical protein GY757_53085 [bacterium]|nr:hypothetical protein [bacterium]